MTVCFQCAPRRSAITRPTMSVELPAAYPTSRRTGLAGYCCATAGSASARTRSGTALRIFMAAPSSMREHFLSRHRHLGDDDLAVQRVGDVERGALGAAEGDVGHEARLLAGVHEMGRQAVRIEAPDPHSEVAYGEPVLLVRLDAVGAGVAARELDRNAGLGERASGHERKPPDLLRARDGHEHVRVGLVERDAIGGGRIVDEALQLAARAQAIHE